MLASLVSKGPTVKIALQNDDLFVRPTLDPDTPSTDPLLAGTVTLELSSPRAVNKITVSIEGICDVSGESKAFIALSFLKSS